MYTQLTGEVRMIDMDGVEEISVGAMTLQSLDISPSGLWCSSFSGRWSHSNLSGTISETASVGQGIGAAFTLPNSRKTDNSVYVLWGNQ